MRAIVVGREVGLGVSPSVGQLGPDVVKASRCEPGPDSENTLATSTTPSLAAALEPGVDDHCVCRLDSPAADGRAGIAGRFVTHPLTVAADRPNGGGDLASPGDRLSRSPCAGSQRGDSRPKRGSGTSKPPDNCPALRRCASDNVTTPNSSTTGPTTPLKRVSTHSWTFPTFKGLSQDDVETLNQGGGASP